jgi:hypothetical protein
MTKLNGKHMKRMKGVYNKMADDKIHPEVIQEESQALMKSTQGLISMTRSDTSLTKTLADDNARRLLTTTMGTFVNVDMRFHVGMQAMGEIVSNFLKVKDEKLQRKWVEAICEMQGIPMIEYNARAPRTSLATALFAKYPEMMQQVKGGKDTKGALRLSNYVMAYKAAKEPPRKIGKGTPRGNGTPEVPNPRPRSAADLFVKLYTAATLKEKNILITLAGRIGIEYEDWLPESDEVQTSEAPAAKA